MQNNEKGLRQIIDVRKDKDRNPVKLASHVHESLVQEHPHSLHTFIIRHSVNERHPTQRSRLPCEFRHKLVARYCSTPAVY